MTNGANPAPDAKAQETHAATTDAGARDDVPASSPPDIRVFVNERGVSIPRNGTALDAVRTHTAELADDITAGRARITDSRGLPLASDARVSGGTILRVLPVRDAAAASVGGDAS